MFQLTVAVESQLKVVERLVDAIFHHQLKLNLRVDELSRFVDTQRYRPSVKPTRRLRRWKFLTEITN